MNALDELRARGTHPEIVAAIERIFATAAFRDSGAFFSTFIASPDDPMFAFKRASPIAAHEAFKQMVALFGLDS